MTRLFSGMSRIALLVVACLASSAYAQRTAKASVAITARLPGYVQLSESELPFIIEVHQGVPSEVGLPVEVVWNLNPRESQAFRVVASFRGTGLLHTNTGRIVVPTALTARVDNNEFRPFTDGCTLVLYMERITTSNRQGREQKTLQLTIEGANAGKLEDGKYYGLLHLEAEPI